MSEGGYTFAVSEVATSDQALLRGGDHVGHLTKRTNKWIEACSGNGSTIGYSQYCRNAFIECALFAFAYHYPLALSPDDIWLCLIQGVATHVRTNAEALREKFVALKDQKKLTVRRDEFVRGSPDNDWPGVVAELTGQVKENMSAWQNEFEGSFSTTTDTHRIVGNIVLLDAMQKYFAYELVTCCGIPHITLLGTLEDWISVRERAARFADLGLEWWLEKLLPILDKFVDARRGTPDVAFWKSFVKHEDQSGGPYIMGWVNVFYPYLLAGDGVVRNKWLVSGTAHIAIEEIPDGRSEVPFVWNYGDTEINMSFIGGFTGINQNGFIPDSPMAVHPEVGWAIADLTRPRREVYNRKVGEAGERPVCPTEHPLKRAIGDGVYMPVQGPFDHYDELAEGEDEGVTPAEVD